MESPITGSEAGWIFRKKKKLIFGHENVFSIILHKTRLIGDILASKMVELI